MRLRELIKLRAGSVFFFVIACAMITGNTAQAMTLNEAVAQALLNDPTYLAAQSNLQVSHERAKQALANLLPQLSASANSSKNRRIYTLQNNNAANNGQPEHYRSSSVQLNLTQPIFHHANIIALEQANIVENESDYQLAAAGQDLLVRLVQAWFDVMQARDAVVFSEAQLHAAKQKWELMRRGSELGIMSLTERENGRASYEQAVADDATARTDEAIKLAALEQIVGKANPLIPALSEKLPEPLSPGHDLNYWLAQARLRNPTLLAAQRALEAATDEIHKQQAGHEPTLDFVASHGRTEQGSGLIGGQSGFTTYQDTVGVQLNLPLFAGGGQSAKVREAIALRDKASHDREAALRKVELEVKRTWYTWRAGHARYLSARQGIKATAMALKGAKSEKRHGVKAELDVLKARQQYERAIQDWHKARYDMIVSRIRLKATAGTLAGEDLATLDKWFRNRM